MFVTEIHNMASNAVIGEKKLNNLGIRGLSRFQENLPERLKSAYD